MSTARHTTSAGGVVVNPEGKVLVVSQGGTSWSLPKGHVEKGEDDLTTARREIAEESGITELELIKPLGKYDRYKMGKNGVGDDKGDYKTIVLFLFKTKQTELKPTDPVNPEARWVDKDKVVDLLTSAKDKEFYQSITQEF